MNIQRSTMKKAAAANYGAVDSQVLEYDPYWAIGCVAMEQVNRALNGSAHRWETAVQGGLDVDMISQGEEESEPGQMPALYAQTYEGHNGLAHLLLTNRSALSHQVTVVVDGEALVGPLETWHVGSQDPGVNNKAPETDLAITTETMENPVTVPAYGVMRVAWPLDSGGLDAPADFTALVPADAPHAVDLSWDAVLGATGYRVKRGVIPGHYCDTVTVSGDVTAFRVSPLGHGMDHFFTVSALLDGHSGPNAPELVAVPANHPAEVFADFEDAEDLAAWTSPDGDSGPWGIMDGALQVVHNQASTLLVSAVPEVSDYRVGVDVTLSALDDDGRFGLIGRYQDANNCYRAYYFQDKERFLIQVVIDGVAATIGRSAILGTDYVKSGEELWFPTIPTLSTDEAHRLRFDLDGETLRLWLDGRLIAAAIDGTYSSGAAGIISRRQPASFDDFEVRGFSLYGGL